ncbi:ribonuclease PH [Prevotella dentalis DSM 3688]|uniref:Ribonuclease PH n=1 Tax=Prevotella dentalis (strain ATCC 49559 / DSM 3688 / JCM 13448 / NCTC 12043 / ES 2772) TaxID=908937 RepID=F9D2J9_PREDD|nr:ribonuclease PH [Prevotella dentalis DSM 3688]
MGGFRQNNISYRWLARWKGSQIPQISQILREERLTQRHGDKEAARGKGSQIPQISQRLRGERVHAKARGQGGCAGIFKSEFGENEWMASD